MDHRPNTAARRPAQTRPTSSAQRNPGQKPPVRGGYSSRAARARKRMMIKRARFGGIVLLLALIIVLAVFQVRNGKNADKVVTAAPTPTPETMQAVAQETPAPVETAAVASDIAVPTQEPVLPTQAPAASSGDVPSYGTAGDGLRSVTIRFAGDIMVCLEQLYGTYNEADGTFNFDPEFAPIAKYLANADFTIANMESTVGKYKDKQYSGYPLFNCPESVLDTLKKCGIDMFTLANNHMLDRWFDGMKNTVNWVEQYGFEHVGAYRTQEERNGTVIIELNGIKFGFLAYTHTTNTQETVCDKAAVEYGVPYLYQSDFKADVARLRAAGAEVVVCMPHWGAEYRSTQDDTQQSYAKKLLDAGVDIIIGSHPHVVQPMGFVGDKFVMYSMGNFISNMTNDAAAGTDCGVILELTVSEQSDGSFKVSNVGYIPTFCWVNGNDIKTLASGEYLSTRPEGMGDSTWARLKDSYNEIVSRLGNVGSVLSE